MDEEVFYQYLKVNNQSEKTLKAYKEGIKKYKTFNAEREITKESLRDYIQHILNSNFKDSSKSWYLGKLKVYLHFLYDWGVIDRDYAELFENIRYASPLPKRPLNEEEVNKIRSVIPVNTINGFRDRVIFEMFYGTGLRRSELLELKINDINFSKKEIFIRQGKGARDRIGYLGENLSSLLLYYLQNIRTQFRGHTDSEKLYLSDYTRKALSYEKLGKIFEEYKKASGVEFSAHILRHSYATELLKKGANILYIQELLGHKKIKTTQKYTHIQPNELIQDVRRYHPRW